MRHFRAWRPCSRTVACGLNADYAETADSEIIVVRATLKRVVLSGWLVGEDTERSEAEVCGIGRWRW